MIKTRENLRQVLKLERLNYLPKGTIFPWIVNSKNYRIYQFQKYLRKEEFYGNNLFSWLNKVLWVWNKKRKNTLGQRLGFDIPMNCFGEGLWIHHVGPVTINGDARIGKNCIIAGNVCIGSNGGGYLPLVITAKLDTVP